MHSLRKIAATYAARLGLALVVAGTIAAPSMFSAGTGPEASRLEGKYRCVQVTESGRSAVCQSPPLILNRDGSYHIWGEYGTYAIVQGRWLVLSHSKRRGMGRLMNPREIVFEYHTGSRAYRVTFRRISDPSPSIRTT